MTDDYKFPDWVHGSIGEAKVMTINDIEKQRMSTAWLQLCPEQDITAFDLWRCLQIGREVRPDEARLIAEDLRRHYKPRSI